MPTLQNMISRLFFVSGDPGDLDLWDPKLTGDTETDLNAGRWGAAMLLHTMRIHDFPGIFYHVNMAWRAKGSKVCDFRQGVELEIGDSVLAAPKNHPELPRVAHLQFNKSDLRKALAALPFTQTDEKGNIQMDRFHLGGDRQQRVETGKFYGAALCRLIQQTGWTNFLVEEPTHEYSPELAEINLGVQQVVAEIAMSADPHCTVYQRAASHFFEGQDTPQPAAPASLVNAI